MRKNKGLWQGGLLYGAIGTGFFILAFLAFYFMDRNPVVQARYLDFVMAPALGFLMLRAYREQWNGGLLHFWEGMTMAFFYGLTLGVLGGGFIYIFLQWIDPQVLVEFKQIANEQIMLQKEQFLEQFSEEVFQEQLKANDETTAATMFGDAVVRKALVALLATSFVAIFMRKTEHS